MTDTRLRLLIIDERNDDTPRILDALHRFGYQPQPHHLTAIDDIAQALHSDSWGLAIVTHHASQSSFNSLLTRLHGYLRLVPVIVITEERLTHDEVVSARQAGVSGVVENEHLPCLGAAVVTALDHWHQQQMGLRSHQLITHLETMRERERAIIARDVHDELGNTLMGLKLEVAWLRRHLTQGERLNEKLVTMGSQLETAIDAMRRIITELRPSVLDDLGLTAAIEWKLNDFCERNGLECQLVNLAEGVVLGGDGDAIAVFRIFLEMLTNIQRHARASRVSVELTLDAHAGELSLIVTDDGIGICETDLHKADSFGILRMRERALRIGGRLRIEKGTPGGTVVALSVPLLGHLN